MKTVTFFSYKGGVGRTLAATNFAVYLAKLGLKAVVIDFDLDAPGIDSKFPGFSLPQGQAGLIDYILQFQRHGGDAGRVAPITCKVQVPSPRENTFVTLIPSGDYMAPDYAAKLNELNWARIFSANRDGVTFFQRFLERISLELSPDVVIVDSRTGFSEIGGLCTQQLADETVILSSMASECIKMTRHLAAMIHDSEIARQLGKSVRTKVVVSRVPNRHADLDKLKSECCERFGVDESSLFFLFSCPALERQEFVAMLDSDKGEPLITSYVQLFQGLDIQVAHESIQKEIERTEKGLLSCTPEEAESRVREMAALYPDPDVYRCAMRFFSLTRRPDDAALYGARLLDLLPSDRESHLQLSRYALSEYQRSPQMFHRKAGRKVLEVLSQDRMIGIIERTRQIGDLTSLELVHYADWLEDIDQYTRSYEVATEYLAGEEGLHPQLRERATSIAARCALKLGKSREASALALSLPLESLSGALASIAIQTKIASGDKSEAFVIAKSALIRRVDPTTLMTAAQLAAELGQSSEIDDIVRNSEEIQGFIESDPELGWELQKLGIQLNPELEVRRPRRRRRGGTNIGD